jgi:phosphotransferase system enzyme I (PtsI)
MSAIIDNSLKGLSISPGIGLGRVCFYLDKKQPLHTMINNFQEDNALIDDAFMQLTNQLSTLTKYAEDNFDDNTAALFKAHKMICDELKTDVIQTISREKISANIAIEQCFNAYSDYFSKLDDDYFSERANDFFELKNLLLNFLHNTEPALSCKEYQTCSIGECGLENEHILITEELSASVAIRIRNHTKGIVTNKCNPNSHAAVIARSLGIPVISGIKNPLSCFSHNDSLLIDGATADIIINPDAATLKKYSAKINQPVSINSVSKSIPGFSVLADIDLYKDVAKAINAKADGIGLYRTEFEMLVNYHMLDEEEQLATYQYLTEHIPNKKIYIRLLDLGSDKSAPWLNLEDEANPALGCRGARLLLARPEMLATQARALAKASRSAAIHVIYPMISSVEQFLQLKEIFITATLDIDGTNISHGIMFEVPSACINASELYEVIDFGRIGSNDLIQYLFAHDRTSEDFNYLKMAKDPAIWKLIMMLSNAAHKAGKPIELCGMLVDIPELVPELIKCNINTVSTRPENIASVRKAARTYFKTTPAIN